MAATQAPGSPAAGTTADAAEVARFAAVAETWWADTGPYKALHRINPLRLAYIRDRIAAHTDRDPLAPEPLKGLRLLDVGCGGGLLCEPLCRLGARVTGIDAEATSIGVAVEHARRMGLKIDYRHAGPEDLVRSVRPFDGVINMEVVEHVDDPAAFLGLCADLVKPRGLMLLSTLNRTLKSLALGKVAAEYVLRWVPPGTHDWRRFVRPAELAAMLAGCGLRMTEVSGMSYDPWRDDWRLSADRDVNYLATAVKGSEGDGRVSDPPLRRKAGLRRGGSETRPPPTPSRR